MAAKEALKESLVDKFKLELKTPKGTRDFGPEEMTLRQKVIDKITNVFKRHGAVSIDTPVFELKEILLGKYGQEGSKLIYDLADQGGENCSLRYDLTVPFARYLATNKIEKIKRYQIAKVYRRDQPVMTKGRYREFFQCDFDIAGRGELMVQDSECVAIIDEVLSALDIGSYEIRINHRLLLEGIFKQCGIPQNSFKTVCSSVDKLDKQPWEEIQDELIKEKGIDEDAVDKLEEFINVKELNSFNDNLTLLKWFSEKKWSNSNESPDNLTANSEIHQAVKELTLLLEYSQLFGCNPSKIVFFPSLARGLDYYTGPIFEVVLNEFSFVPKSPSNSSAKDSKNENNEDERHERPGNLGSIAAGGRYDNLVGVFSEAATKSKKPFGVQCVGFSFGIERIFTIMELKNKSLQKELRTSSTDVFVASVRQSGSKTDMLRERMRFCSQLWKAGINAEMLYKNNPMLMDQIQFSEKNTIPLMILFGDDELSSQTVKIRKVASRNEQIVKETELIEKIKELLRSNETNK